MIPSLFRPELWHPLTTHFPIALLSVGAMLKLAGMLRAARTRDFLFESGVLMSAIGVTGAWLAWYTGGIAEEEVNSKICDPTLTHLHGDYAFYVTLAFSAITVIDLLGKWPRATRAVHAAPAAW